MNALGCNGPGPASRRAALALALAALPFVAGCGGASEDAADEQPDQSARDIDRYQTRGVVVQLPSETNDLQIRHEAVPEFRGPGGELGMNVMTMPFWPPQGVEPDPERVADFSLEGVEPGDKVLVTWEVVYDTDAMRPLGFYATAIEELPADTELDFTPLPADAPAPAGD